MVKYNFKNDYSDGGHPRILTALKDCSSRNAEGYGLDEICMEAACLIRKEIENYTADVHFVSGGTQANMVVLSSMLRPYESVISASSAHIAIHEAGSVEASGHKINAVNTTDGKLTVDLISRIYDAHRNEHMVQPRIVFISQSTEMGTIYKSSELTNLSRFCRENNLYLYMDGARLGSALTSTNNDLFLNEISKLVDVFYIGGTKNGALLGEAIVITNPGLQENFRYVMKQKGALLAKGQLYGIQFKELFRNGLFYELGRHANEMATMLADGIQKQNHPFSCCPETNQIFPIFPNKLIELLSRRYDFHIWDEVDEFHSVVRLVASWNTLPEAVEEFLMDLKKWA